MGRPIFPCHGPGNFNHLTSVLNRVNGDRCRSEPAPWQGGRPALPARRASFARLSPSSPTPRSTSQRACSWQGRGDRLATSAQTPHADLPRWLFGAFAQLWDRPATILVDDGLGIPCVIYAKTTGRTAAACHAPAEAAARGDRPTSFGLEPGDDLVAGLQPCFRAPRSSCFFFLISLPYSSVFSSLP